jgi:hypothetical protein
MKTSTFLLCLDSSIDLLYSKCGLLKSVQLPLIISGIFILLHMILLKDRELQWDLAIFKEPQREGWHPLVQKIINK